MKEKVIVDKSYAFAIRTVKLLQCLKVEKQEYVLAKQVLRSSISIGANIEEAVAGGLLLILYTSLTLPEKRREKVVMAEAVA